MPYKVNNKATKNIVVQLFCVHRPKSHYVVEIIESVFLEFEVILLLEAKCFMNV